MLIWTAFIILILVFLAIDLGVFNREPHKISTKEAVNWTTLWVSVSLLFSGVVYLLYDGNAIANADGLTAGQAVLKYLTGYIIELSLSLDNIFVIAVIFTYFRVPNLYQHRVLFWGIIGAIIFRGIMILLGIALIKQFAWVTILFGILLLYSAYNMLTQDEEAPDPEKNPMIRIVKRFFPVTEDFVKDHFFVKKGAKWMVTPLFIALLVVETTDVLFALDSIPAIFAITTDPFIVFSSNIFAILGLRSLYFVLAAMLDKFKYLQYSLVFILAYVGIKMMLLHYVHFPEWLSLTVILGGLAAGVVYSLYRSSRESK